MLPSVTRFFVMEKGINCVRIALSPLTGRTHQLRVHCATNPSMGGLGAPMIGDSFYGNIDTTPEHLSSQFLALSRNEFYEKYVKQSAGNPFRDNHETNPLNTLINMEDFDDKALPHWSTFYSYEYIKMWKETLEKRVYEKRSENVY